MWLWVAGIVISFFMVVLIGVVVVCIPDKEQNNISEDIAYLKGVARWKN